MIGFCWLSSTVSVRVVVDTPSAVTVDGEATKVVFANAAEPAVNETVVVRVTASAPVPRVAVMVFTPALVEVSVVLKTPAAFVTPVGARSVFPVPPATLSETWMFTRGSPFAFCVVTVNVVTLRPSATTLAGDAVKVDVERLGSELTAHFASGLPQVSVALSSGLHCIWAHERAVAPVFPQLSVQFSAEMQVHPHFMSELPQLSVAVPFALHCRPAQAVAAAPELPQLSAHADAEVQVHALHGMVEHWTGLQMPFVQLYPVRQSVVAEHVA